MQKFKALVIDLDDTTVPAGHLDVTNPDVVNTIKQAKKKVAVSTATGRSFPYCREIIRTLDLVDPCIVSAGCEIIDPNTERIVWEKKMDIKTVNKLLKICQRYKHPVYATTGGDLTVLGTAEKNEGVLYILNVPLEEEANIINEFSGVTGIAIISTASWDGNHLRDIHLTDINATKKNALVNLRKLLGVKKEEVIVVGDSPNDLPLFEEAGFKVAMGNAIKPLKEQADYIAPPISENGLIDVINKFIL